MALFNAENILNPQEHEETLVIDCFKLPEGEVDPTIEIVINSDVRAAAIIAEMRHSSIRIVYGKQPTGEIINEPGKYCEKVLRKAYKDSSGLVDKPTKSIIIKLIHQQPILAKAVASKLMSVLSDAEMYAEKQADDDEQD